MFYLEDMKKKYKVLLNVFLYVRVCVEDIVESLELMEKFDLENTLSCFSNKV